jgi:hypothetical protein
MQGRASSIVAIAALAVVSLAGPAPASAIPSRYKAIPVVPNTGTITNPGIDEAGNVGLYGRTKAGLYEIDRVYDPTYQGRTLEVILRKSGSDANILPEWLRDPTRSDIEGFNASGIVIGRHLDDSEVNGPFYYDVEVQALDYLKGLPGAISPPVVYDINDHGQIVGTEDGKAIVYSSPEAVPVELTALLDGETGLRLITASGINNRGEIAVYHDRTGVSVGFSRLEPQAVPEPSSIIVFAVTGMIVARFSAIGRRRRPERASS